MSDHSVAGQPMPGYISDRGRVRVNNTQHGFRAALSTESALLTLSNKLYKNIENGNISLVTLCDLSKAFECQSSNIIEQAKGTENRHILV